MQQFPHSAKLMEGRVATLSARKGASMVRWTILDFCPILSESDSKPYTNLNFVKKKEP